MKKIFIFFGLIVIANQSYSQSLKIPKTASVLVSVDVAKLNKELDTKFKVDIDTSYDNLTEIPTVLLNAIKSPKAIGIDKKRKVLIYADEDQIKEKRSRYSKPTEVIILPISNVSMFEANVISRLEKSTGMTRSTRDGYTYFNHQHTNVIYNKEYAVFQRSNNYKRLNDQLYNSQYYYEYNQVIRAINLERHGKSEGDLGTGTVQQKVQKIADLGDERYKETELVRDDYPTDEIIVEEVTEEAVEATEVVEDVEVDQVAEEEPAEAYINYNRKDRSYDYDAHPLMKSFKNQWVERRKNNIRNENIRFEIQNFKSNLSRLETTTSVGEQHKRVLNSDHDIAVWYSTKTLNQFLMGTMGYSYRRMIRNMSEDDLYEKFKDNFTIGYLDIDKSKLNISLVNHLSDEFKKFNSLVNKPVNPNFKYYLPKNTSAYYSTYMSPEKLYNAYIGVMDFSLSGSRYNKEGALIMLDMLDLFMNKEMLFETLRGDMVYAISGNQMQISERTRYKYNEETYEREKVIVKDTTYAPEMIGVATLKNKKQMQDLINAFEKRGFIVKQQEGVYRAKKNMRKGDMSPFYIGIKDDLFILTNNNSLAKNYMAVGLPKSMRLETDNMKNLNEIGSNFRISNEFFNLPNMNSRGMTMYPPLSVMPRALGDFQKSIDLSTMHTYTNDEGEVVSEVNIELKDGTNLLKDLIESSKK